MTQSADQTAGNLNKNPAPFATYEVDDVVFRFRKPKTSELDHVMQKMRKATVSAFKAFSAEIVFPSDQAAWSAVIADKPGAASEAMNEVLEKLGFRL